MRIISDVHGRYNQYINIIQNVEYSLQLGDFGFDYKILDGVDPNKHKFIKGNHDNHDLTPPHCLSNFGYSTLAGLTFFHVQGAFSIDWKERVHNENVGGGKSWWENEQLSYSTLCRAIDLYEIIKPDLVFTHEAPRSVVPEFSNPRILASFGYDPETFTTQTSEALQTMLEIHRPKRWRFAHYHITWKKIINGTEFGCLPELGYEDLY